MSAPELLPCPWCGPMNGHYGFTIGRFGTRLTCFCCDSHGPKAATKEEAMAAWNTRADLPPTLAAHHVTPQIAAQIICDMVLQMESPEGAEMRSAMINATMSTKVGGVTRWKRWAMVNEAIRALAAMDEAKP